MARHLGLTVGLLVGQQHGDGALICEERARCVLGSVCRRYGPSPCSSTITRVALRPALFCGQSTLSAKQYFNERVGATGTSTIQLQVGSTPDHTAPFDASMTKRRSLLPGTELTLTTLRVGPRTSANEHRSGDIVGVVAVKAPDIILPGTAALDPSCAGA